MSDPERDLPVPVQRAQKAMDDQRATTLRMMGGMMAMMITIVLGAGAGLPDGGILALVASMMIWILIHVVLMGRSSTEWQRARTVLQEWDRKTITTELAQALRRPSPQEDLDDPRWQAVTTLLARIRELAGDDAHTVEVSEEVRTRLRGLIEDQATLRSAIEADRALGGDSDAAQQRTSRLEEALTKREGTANRLVEAIRDLHVELAVRDASADPIVDRLEALLDQVEAEAEIASVGSSDRDERARLAAAQRSTMSRE